MDPVRFPVVLFDLDGTLVDSIELILASHRHATREVLGASPPDDVLRRGIGTPLWVQMRTIDAPRADELVTAYRAFNHRMHDELLRPLRGSSSSASSSVPMAPARCRDLEVAARDRDGVRAARLRPAARRRRDRGSDRAPQAASGADPRGAQRLDRDASGACYVGDSPFDLQAGRAAGRRPDRRDLGRVDRGRAARRAPRRAGSHARRARGGAAWQRCLSRACSLVAPRARAAQPPVPRRGRARDRRCGVRRALPRARRARGAASRAADARLAHAARRRAWRRAGSRRCATSSRCCRSPTPAMPTSCSRGTPASGASSRQPDEATRRAT